MKSNKAAWLAWGLFGAIIAATLYGASGDAFQASAQGDLQSLGTVLLWALIPIVFACVGALIISRQPRNVIGWLVMLPALASGLNALITLPLRGVTSAPSNPSFALFAALWFGGTSWVLIVFPLFFVALLFPNGKPLTPRWRWVIGYGIALVLFFYFLATFVQQWSPTNGDGTASWTIQNPIGFIPQDVMDTIFSLWWGVALAVLALLSALALVLRFRRADLVERAQIKWLLAAAVLFAVSYVPAIVTQGETTGYVAALLNLLFAVGVFAFPIAIGIAILRYRLWDIDVIIRRTVTYAIVVGLLLAVYFGSVILLQQVFASLTGERSEIITILSTLAIAALFIPLRNRVQNAIDRRFNRQRYDAQQVLTKFALTMRDETDLDALSAELLNAVNETMQPKSVSLWLSRGNQKRGIG